MIAPYVRVDDGRIGVLHRGRSEITIEQAGLQTYGSVIGNAGFDHPVGEVGGIVLAAVVLIGLITQVTEKLPAVIDAPLSFQF